jgi:aryl-alcohol dehydrogenase-like predicted oxidoreductase
VARGEPGAGHGTNDVWKRWQQARMDELLDGMSATEFMLRFTMSNPDVHTIIVGTLNPAHLHDNVTAVLHGPLSAPVYTEARRRLGLPEAVST